MVLNSDKKLPTYGTESFKQDNISSTNDHPRWMFWKTRRYLVAFLAFFGFFNVYSLRVNLSIAIVAMTENKTITLENNTIIHTREFDWDSKIQGYVLSSFFYGYIMTQLLGGILATRIGGNKVYGFGIAITALLTLVSPFLASAHVYLLIGVRIVEGFFEGVVFPCMHAIWAKWAPPLERSRLVTIAIAGSYVGTVVSMPLCAYLAQSLGWASTFYFCGGIALIWYVIWTITVTKSPEEDKYISKYELEYIQKHRGNEDQNKRIVHPWREIFTSMPVWAIIVSHFSENWGFYTMLTQLPTFMKDVLKFNLEKTGIMSALPYLVMAIMIPIAGTLADWLQENNHLTTTQVRKLFNCGAFLAQTVFMMGAAYLMSPVGCLICLSLAVGFGAFAWAGFSVNHLDIAPQHASVLMGISNTVGTIPGIISPIISGYIVTTPTPSEWRIIFFIASGIYLIGCVFYAIFASGELQPWAIDKKKDDDLSMTKNLNSGKINKAFDPES